jgi:hypothetical protein
MTYTIVTGDLFTAPRGTVLAHCISADFALGAGIAKTFDHVYDMKAKLNAYYPNYFFEACDREFEGQALLVDDVFNLVTKPHCYDKPTYETLAQALVDMVHQMHTFHMKKLAMPKIGCGLDRLDWEQVEVLIKGIFEDTDIDITIYELEI